MKMAEWLQMGIDNEWCSTTFCYTHDFPDEFMTDKEAHDWYEGNEEPCIFVIRVNDV